MHYPSDIVARIDALFEPGESSVFTSDWTYNMPYQEWQEMGLFTDAHWETKNQVLSVTVSLTQERLYFIWFETKMHFLAPSTREVHSFWSIPLASIVYQSFDKVKDKRGALLSYQFTFQSTHPNAQNVPSPIFGQPREAESFMDRFKPAIARFVALSTPVDMAAQLRALQALVNEGVLTDDEMTRAKELFLGRPPDQRQLMERNLRSLHDLRVAGVLTQVEFDIKKRDILATTR